MVLIAGHLLLMIEVTLLYLTTNSLQDRMKHQKVMMI